MQKTPTDEPAPHRTPEAFDLRLAETPEVIRKRIVTRKALHAKQRVLALRAKRGTGRAANPPK